LTRKGVRGVAPDGDAFVSRARALGVLGWVRADDRRFHAEGESEGVDELVEGLDVEPARVEGHEQFAVRGVSAGAFSVREHERGYELRLEVDGAARAWTLPKAPSMDPADKRFAIEAPGSAAEGGEVWDRGTYEQGGRVPWPEALDRGHAVFVLHGERLRGGFALQRTPRGWLLVKRRDGQERRAS
jgi:hypothetical protein